MSQVLQTSKGVTVLVSAIDNKRVPPVPAPLPVPSVTATDANNDNITVTALEDGVSFSVVPTDGDKPGSVDLTFTCGGLTITDHFAYTPSDVPVATDLVLTVTQN